MSRLTVVAPESEIVPVAAELPIKMSPRSTCKFARIAVGAGPMTTSFEANTFVVETAFDTYTLPVTLKPPLIVVVDKFEIPYTFNVLVP
jgi:hypothetical protein